jgi:CCR4-NOT transcription complex subunit 3
LQRLRDQIKTWLGSSEVKDKGQLTEARKIIESKMEQFKICEKDTKTKAYSKEGLARDARTDPKEIEREEKTIWLNDCLNRLGDLVDSIDVDIEKIVSVKGGKIKMKAELEKLDNRLQKSRLHIARLEQILKLLDRYMDIL